MNNITFHEMRQCAVRCSHLNWTTYFKLVSLLPFSASSSALFHFHTFWSSKEKVLDCSGLNFLVKSFSCAAPNTSRSRFQMHFTFGSWISGISGISMRFQLVHSFAHVLSLCEHLFHAHTEIEKCAVRLFFSFCFFSLSEMVVFVATVCYACKTASLNPDMTTDCVWARMCMFFSLCVCVYRSVYVFDGVSCC